MATQIWFCRVLDRDAGLALLYALEWIQIPLSFWTVHTQCMTVSFQH